MSAHAAAALPEASCPRATGNLSWQTVDAAERVLALGLMAAAAPLCVLCAGVIWAISRRPPLVAHRRMGRSGTSLWVLKLRTMWDSEGALGRAGLVEFVVDEAGPLDKSASDRRITSRFARFCRKFSIDELPQLLQVLCGDMALVGPRPITALEMREHYREAAAEVLTVKPGITGLWQVMGRDTLTYAQRRRLDLFLVRRWSVGLYWRILCRTVPAVVTGRNAT